MSEGLVYIGKVIELLPIEKADFIVAATVVCGSGGKWKGVIQKGQFSIGSKCVVFLPDALVPESDEMRFLEKSGWRVKMQRFKGMPSEVVIMPLPEHSSNIEVGFDCTLPLGITKYCKPVPPHLAGKAKGNFPSFIPKTDELHYQKVPEQLEQLHGNAYVITEKCDGSSTTAYKYRGQFGVCSRNLELIDIAHNGYWTIAKQYNLPERLPEGIALQWETCGPRIQNNPQGLRRLSGFAFSAYNIEEKRYLEFKEFVELCNFLCFPRARLVDSGISFNHFKVAMLGEGEYENGAQREGVVVRSMTNVLGDRPISFKVINLKYEEGRHGKRKVDSGCDKEARGVA